MGAIGFYLFYGMIRIFTLLPLRVLYLLSDLLFLVLYYFPSYRRKVVTTNLKNAYPEKSGDEILKIKRGYYTLTLELLFEHIAGLPEHTVTEAHVRRLEELIREKPEYWIWSHRRWKFQHEQQND